MDDMYKQLVKRIRKEERERARKIIEEMELDLKLNVANCGCCSESNDDYNWAVNDFEEIKQEALKKLNSKKRCT